MDRLKRINLKQLAGEALGFVLMIAVVSWSLSHWFRGFETPSPWLCAVLTSAAAVLVIGLPSTLRRHEVRVPHLGLLLSPLGVLTFALFLWPLVRHREPQAEFWQVYLAVGIVAGFGFLMDRLLSKSKMTKITVELDEAKAALLRQRAEKYGLQPEQFVTASIEDLLAQPDAEFEAVADQLIKKNRDLYEKLS